MKKVDTFKYISVLRELTEQGKEVSLLISGNSMSPFLVHQRDTIFFRKPERELKSGDMVFFQRISGEFIMHRICKINKEGYFVVGDAQNYIEGPIKREQIFAYVTKVQRKGKLIKPGDFWWEFFEHVWIRMIPLRRVIRKSYNLIYKLKKG